MKSNRGNRLANFIHGFSSVFATVGTRREYITPSRSGFLEDAMNISDDYKVVAANLRRATSHIEHEYKVR